jgi:hypothetical protein
VKLLEKPGQAKKSHAENSSVRRNEAKKKAFGFFPKS